VAERPAVALIPPLGEDRTHFDAVRAALGDLRVVDLDLFVPTDTQAQAQAQAQAGGPRGAPLRRTAVQDAENAARELTGLIGHRPVIVVGASYGGLVARLLAVQPTGPGVPRLWLAGIVLVDSPHEYLAPTMSGLVGPRAASAAGSVAGEPVDLPASFRQAGRLSAPGSLGDVPLVVLARRQPDWSGTGTWARTADRMWRAHQRMLLPLSSDAWYEEVTIAGRWVAKERPDVVARYIRSVADRHARG
jgi:pimeloyl-ACP methyl ester carboxylesterase